jgi:CRP/FNR family transcriptional activator FtrB
VDLPVVRDLELFASMEQDCFEELMQAAYLQWFPPRLQLIAEGDPADFLYVVTEGSVELFARGNQRETTIAIFEPVSTFILAAVLKDAAYLMSARTLEPSRILMIPSENIRLVMDKDSAFARAIVRELAIRYRTTIMELKHQKLRTGVERLANYLLREHDKQGARGELTLGVDKRTLASLLGMTPENLSRAFGTLGPYGVEVDGGQIRLSKIRDLKILAKPTPLIDDPNS